MLDKVKEYLKITWDDENISLNGIIDRGKAYLQDLTGTTLDFNKAEQPKSLLFDYCRYAYNNGLEFFGENFKSEILRLQLLEGVKALEK